MLTPQIIEGNVDRDHGREMVGDRAKLRRDLPSLIENGPASGKDADQ